MIFFSKVDSFLIPIQKWNLLPLFLTHSKIRAQASKALSVCESKNEFEGSSERVEFEKLLIEAHHKHKYALDEINRLKNIFNRGQLDAFKGKL